MRWRARAWFSKHNRSLRAAGVQNQIGEIESLLFTTKTGEGHEGIKTSCLSRTVLLVDSLLEVTLIINENLLQSRLKS